MSDAEEPLAGSVSPYQQHLAICTGGPPELWQSRVEEMEGVFGALEVALRVRGLHKQIKMTACDAPSTGAEGFDIFLLPDMLILPEITVHKVEALADAMVKQFEEGLPFDVQPMAGGDHIFVCVHANRDERCGVWGPLFYTALQREIQVQDAIAHVHQTSHIGGHRYAATCIVYPQGVWYGNLRPEDAARLVDEHLNQEQLLPEFYRGRLGITPLQQSAEAAAVGQLLRQHSRYDTVSVDVVAEGDHAIAHARARVPTTKGLQSLESRFHLRRQDYYWLAEETFHFETRE
jgi:(2Fe-2S) ferredoxin